MELVLRDLNRSVIFSEEDIESIKRFLRRQHENSAGYEIALMSAQLINNRVNQALTGIDKKYWWQFKSVLIKLITEEDKTTITKADVFRLLLSIEAELDSAVRLAQQWLMLQRREIICNHTVETYIKALRSEQSTVIVPWKRMSVAAASLVVVSSLSVVQPLRTTVKPEGISSAERIRGHHNQVGEARVSEMAFIHAQNILKEKQAEAEAQQFREMKKEKWTPVKIVEPIIKGKRVAVYPTRIVNDKIGERYMLPAVIAIKDYDVEKLRDVLIAKDSKLASEPYFGEIIKSAEAYGIDPRFVFAIAAQEQGLVRNTHDQAEKIANNPFNVYGSWKRYNTTITRSSDIVCRTIVKRMNKWTGVGDPIVWLNKTYASDKNWSRGVKWHFQSLSKKSQAM